MPHVIIKMHADRSTAEKQALAEAITAAMREVLGHDPDKASIGLEEIEPADWMRLVYGPDMIEREAHLLKRPGYGPLSDGSVGGR